MIPILISLFWLLRQTKSILFWLFLWQLKEYHTGRFADHFRTEKGKRLLINKLFGIKIFLLLTYFIYPLVLIFGLFLIYTLEALKALKDIFEKKIKAPVLTKKTIFLISIGLLVEISFLIFLSRLIKGTAIGELIVSFPETTSISLFSFWLLIFDILTPAIVSVFVLIFQPLAVLGRNQIINRAKRKREMFKNL